MKRIRHQNGGVFLDRRVATWYFRKTTSDGKRKLTRIGTLAEYPTKKAAVLASAKLIGDATEAKSGVTFEAVARRYIAERMPTQFTTAGGYRNYLENYRIARWGDMALAAIAIEPMAVWQWVNQLCHPKTGSHSQDRVGGGITPAGLSHHRTCASASGGS